MSEFVGDIVLDHNPVPLVRKKSWERDRTETRDRDKLADIPKNIAFPKATRQDHYSCLQGKVAS